MGTLKRFIKETGPFACSHRDLLISGKQAPSDVVCLSIVTHADRVGALWAVGTSALHTQGEAGVHVSLFLLSHKPYFSHQVILSIIAGIIIQANLSISFYETMGNVYVK